MVLCSKGQKKRKQKLQLQRKKFQACWTGSENHQYGLGSPNNQSSPSENKEMTTINSCQICGKNNHIALMIFYRWDYSYLSAHKLSQAMT